MDSPDIIFIKPGSQKKLYGELSAFSITAIEPPLWAALLAAHVRSKGFSTDLFDAEYENRSPEETAGIIGSAAPMVAAIVVSGTNPSASTMNMTGAGAIINHLKKLFPEIKTLLMGLHPSALPERTMLEENADFVCEGEGFNTLPQLLDALKENREDFPIAGLWYKKDGHIISNPRAQLFKDLDALPMPAWDLLPMDNYRAHNWHCFEDINARQPYAVIYTSLGCPFKCSFCCVNSFFGKSGIRFRSPEKVIEEIDYLVKCYGIRNIKILDEMFALKETHVSRLCDLIVERGYDLNIWAYARVSTITETMLLKMREAGIKWIAYGFESGSDKVLKGVTKGYTSDMADEVVRMTNNAGLYICANFIFGLPDDDHDSMQRTLDRALDINAEWANFYSAMAYPGSMLYRDAVKNGLPLPETWQGYSQYGYETLPLPTKYLSSSQVLRFRDHAFDVYFSNPAYLDKIGTKFENDTVRHIREISSFKLARKYADE